jgi:hypothetical protein
MATVSSDMGNHQTYRKYTTLPGGSAVLSFDHWATRANKTHYVPRGHGTYTVTTYNGRHGYKITIICAYIAVQKGLELGETSVYSQQCFIMEQKQIREKTSTTKIECPRIEAMKALQTFILQLQQQKHSIILCLVLQQR